jgi:hypothetical protein
VAGVPDGGRTGVDWYETVFEVIDMRSFSNLWFWIALAGLWSSASHYVLGVPFDMVTRARRHGAQAAEDVDALAQISVRRILYVTRMAGLWLAAFVAFILTSLGVLGFGYDVEFAQALLLLAAPMTLVGALSVRTAILIERTEARGPDLWKSLLRHRLAVQGIGGVSIFVTAMWGMWQNLNAAIL